MKKLLIILSIPLLALLFASEGYAKKAKMSTEEKLSKCETQCSAETCMDLARLKQCRGWCGVAKKGTNAFKNKTACLGVAKKARAQAKEAQAQAKAEGLKKCAGQCDEKTCTDINRLEACKGWCKGARGEAAKKFKKCRSVAKIAGLEHCTKACGWDQCGTDKTGKLVKQCRQWCRAKKGTKALAAKKDCLDAARAVKKGTFKPKLPPRPALLHPPKGTPLPAPFVEEKAPTLQEQIRERLQEPGRGLKKVTAEQKKQPPLRKLSPQEQVLEQIRKGKELRKTTAGALPTPPKGAQLPPKPLGETGGAPLPPPLTDED